MIDWVGKKPNSRSVSHDLTICFAKSTKAGKSDRYIFIFHNNSADKISQEYIQIGFQRNAIYFREVEAENGFKLSKLNRSGSRSLSITASNHKMLTEAIIGKYNLVYDSALDMYFVKLAKKERKGGKQTADLQSA